MVIPDRQERLAAIVERARHIPPLPVQKKTPVQRVPGCVSPVWLSEEMHEGRVRLHADAESPLVRGLVQLLCEAYDGGLPGDVATTEVTLFEALDLLRELTPTRRNGLAAVRTRIRAFAQLHAKA